MCAVHAVTENWERKIKERSQRAALFIDCFRLASLSKVSRPIDFGNTTFRNRNFANVCSINPAEANEASSR